MDKKEIKKFIDENIPTLADSPDFSLEFLMGISWTRQKLIDATKESIFDKIRDKKDWFVGKYNRIPRVVLMSSEDYYNLKDTSVFVRGVPYIDVDGLKVFRCPDVQDGEIKMY